MVAFEDLGIKMQSSRAGRILVQNGILDEEINDARTALTSQKKRLTSDGASARTPAVVLRGMPGRPTTKIVFY